MWWAYADEYGFQILRKFKAFLKREKGSVYHAPDETYKEALRRGEGWAEAIYYLIGLRHVGILREQASLQLHGEVSIAYLHLLD